MKIPSQRRLQTREQWREDKLAQLRDGYATQRDREMRAIIRQRQADGCAASPAQLRFSEMVEAAMRNDQVA